MFFRHVQQVYCGIKISVISISEKVVGTPSITIRCCQHFSINIINGNSTLQVAILIFLSKEADTLNSIHPSFDGSVPLVKSCMKHLEQ